jgi:hypothetical protein
MKRRSEAMRPRLSKALVERARDVRPLLESDSLRPVGRGDTALIHRLVAIGIEAVERQHQERAHG